MSWHEDDAGAIEGARVAADNAALIDMIAYLATIRYCRGCGIDLTRFNRAGEKTLCRGCDAPPPIEDV